MIVRREMESKDCVFMSDLGKLPWNHHVFEVLLMGGIVHGHMCIDEVMKRTNNAYNNNTIDIAGMRIQHTSA